MKKETMKKEINALSDKLSAIKGQIIWIEDKIKKLMLTLSTRSKE